MSKWWCHRCNRATSFVRTTEDHPICPYCHGGFVEEVNNPNNNISNHEDEEDREDLTMTQMMQSLTRFIQHMPNSQRSPFFTDPFFSPHGPMEDPDVFPFPFPYNEALRRRLLHGNLGDFYLGPALEQLVSELALADRSAGGGGPPPASRASVEALESVRIGGRDAGSQCAVCKDEFGVAVDVKKMPCQHLYHSDCILPWLARHNSCPVCRYEMPTEDEEYDRMHSRVRNAGSTSGRRFRIPHIWPFRASNRTSGQAQAETSSSQPNGIPGSSPRTPEIDDDGDMFMSEAREQL